jgi:hypothetical protein
MAGGFLPDDEAGAPPAAPATEETPNYLRMLLGQGDPRAATAPPAGIDPNWTPNAFDQPIPQLDIPPNDPDNMAALQEYLGLMVNQTPPSPQRDAVVKWLEANRTNRLGLMGRRATLGIADHVAEAMHGPQYADSLKAGDKLNEAAYPKSTYAAEGLGTVAGLTAGLYGGNAIRAALLAHRLNTMLGPVGRAGPQTTPPPPAPPGPASPPSAPAPTGGAPTPTQTPPKTTAPPTEPPAAGRPQMEPLPERPIQFSPFDPQSPQPQRPVQINPRQSPTPKAPKKLMGNPTARSGGKLPPKDGGGQGGAPALNPMQPIGPQSDLLKAPGADFDTGRQLGAQASQAAAQMRQAIASDPTHPVYRAIVDQGLSEAGRNTRLSAARQALEAQGVTLPNKSIHKLVNRVTEHAQQAKVDDALAELGQTLRGNPQALAGFTGDNTRAAVNDIIASYAEQGITLPRHRVLQILRGLQEPSAP